MVDRALLAIMASLILFGYSNAQEGPQGVSPFYGYTGSERHRLLQDNQQGVRELQHRPQRRSAKTCTVPDEVNGGRVEVPCNDHRQYCEQYVFSERNQKWELNPRCDLSQKTPPSFYRGTGQYYRSERERDDRRAVREERRATPERVVERQERSRPHRNTDQRTPRTVSPRDAR